MKVITVKNIPDDLYKIIVRNAKRSNRSIQQQVLTILDRVRILDGESPVEKASEIRLKLKGRRLGNSIDEIRKERER
jgi:plasmid stability protein